MKFRHFAAALLSAVLLTGCGEPAQDQSDALFAADLFAMDTYMNLKATGTDPKTAAANSVPSAFISSFDKSCAITSGSAVSRRKEIIPLFPLIMESEST